MNLEIIGLPISGGIPKKRGQRFLALLKGIDFTQTQNLIIPLDPDIRYVLTSARMISNIIAALTGGATLAISAIDNTTPTKASLSTSQGSNKDLTFTAVAGGTGGNSITVAYVNPSANNAVLGVVVTGNAIVVNLATGSGGAITSTGSTILAALQASAPAMALITVALASGSSGAGTVAAMAATNLAGGLAWTLLFVLVASASLANTDSVGKVQSMTVAAPSYAFKGNYELLVAITGGATATTDNKDIALDLLST